MAGTKVAVDFGGSGLRAVQFTAGKKGPTIKKIAAAPLPDGVIVNGSVVEVEALTAVLKQVWKENKFSSKEVVFGMSNDRTVSRMADFEWLPDAEFAKSLKFQASAAGHVEYGPDEALWTYHTLNEFSLPDPTQGPEGMKRIRQVLLVAGHKDMVQGYVDAMRGAGLYPAHGEFTPFALIRAAMANPHEIAPSPDTAEAVVDIGSDLTNIVIHHGGQPRFVRVISGHAGRSLTNILASQFQNWTPEDAERTKVELGLGANDASLQQHPAQDIINTLVSSQIAQIRESVEFFIASSPQISGLHRLMLTGGGSNLKGLAQRLASELRVPVVVGAPVHHMSTDKKVSVPEGLSETQLSACLGLAMGAGSR